MNGSSRSIRRQALESIARLSASTASVDDAQSDFRKLYGALPKIGKDETELPSSHNGSNVGAASLAHTPMKFDELHVLLALCGAAPQIDNAAAARYLLDRLDLYLLEAHAQTFAYSPFRAEVEPSPWEALTKNLVAAALCVGIRHPLLHGRVHGMLSRYLENCRVAADGGIASRGEVNGSHASPKARKPPEIVILCMSLLGFLEALAVHFYFYDSEERFPIVQALRSLLSNEFLIAVEGSLSSVRNAEPAFQMVKDLKVFIRRYSASGRPLGAMLLQQGFLRVLVSCASLSVTTAEALQKSSILDCLMAKTLPPRPQGGEMPDPDFLDFLLEVGTEMIHVLDDGADYLELGSTWQQQLAFKVRGHALTVLLLCTILDEEATENEILMPLLDASMADPVQMADEELASIILKSLAIVSKTSLVIATALSHSLPRFIVQGGVHGNTVTVAAQCLTSILQQISQDAVITGLYSLGNVLSAGNIDKGPNRQAHNSVASRMSVPNRYTQHATTSAISLGVSGDEETSAAHVSIVQAIVKIAIACNDEKITSLAQSMLLQKLRRNSLSVDLQIIIEVASLGAIGGENDLKSLLKFYDRMGHDSASDGNLALLDALMKARCRLIRSVPKNSPSFQIVTLHLLEAIVSKGELHKAGDSYKADVELSSQEIGQLLKPLALIAPYISEFADVIEGESTAPLQREVWFNLAVHGIIPGSSLWEKHRNELRELAIYTKPLVAEDRIDHLESDIDLNTVLRRGMTGPRTIETKTSLIKLLPRCEASIRALAYPKVIFLHAAYAVETLRAETGSCSDVLAYFADPGVNGDETSAGMTAVADEVMSIFLRRTLTGLQANSTAPYVAKQLAEVLQTCCHRIEKCQAVAQHFADKLIMQMPSALCQKESLFTLLELLSLLWISCLDAEINEYEWKSNYISRLANVSLELSDDFNLRKRTLSAFHKRAKAWVMRVMNIAPLDIKGLLQTYLSEFEDDGASWHLSLGRSFALEMGSAIPTADQRLGSIERQEGTIIDTGSDFIAQYTTRQEYKYAEALPNYDNEWANLLKLDNQSIARNDKIRQSESDTHVVLSMLARRAIEGKFIAMNELRDILRRTAALICRSDSASCSTVQHLVGIPFTIFTKQSIRLGISIWLGVINENPIMESRFLVEIARHWEISVRSQRGAFAAKLLHVDPFFIKEEFAPSDRNFIIKQQQAVHNLIAPHLHVLQFLSSHFNAYRLGSPHLRRTFLRLIGITLPALRRSACHPLAREFHFHVIYFGLALLRYSDELGKPARWRLKDNLLSTALSWFAHAPRWSYGGNRLQIKAEYQLLVDVEAALKQVADIGATATGTLKSLALKQDLLHSLIENERGRLQVWLFPMSHEHGGFFAIGNRSDKAPLANISTQTVQVAWKEDPRIAIQVAIRSQSEQVLRDVRSLLISNPEQCLDDAEALHILLNGGLSRDAAVALKYLLYWTPVNPISAATYFLPSYDITFFYVPQIVQTLRYDTLGYVERYIIETAKFSQLFAHQIIWSMKANSYKDEDSTIEDPLKPTLDRVMKNMIDGFSGVDKDFYEREFAFFAEITDISGKLKPYIKKEKSEKKQKIEEELRKIKVDVGVYLPCNPEGVVVGIDRKSGKPLQSHAKAPYMATFRVRKSRGDMGETESLLENTNKGESTAGVRGASSALAQESTFEVWQSAIFKVGDDCRQDVLALQMIAAFRGIFHNVGLDVFVYPNRVTATAPGRGVIDVLPNSISRDMLGREAVNGLYDYFVSKYGGEDSIRFQEARSNFVKSMAAYSVISYLLQFKDRHNGNIMIDDAGHILHIDFGFCFDIAPGGIRFERAPFKLTGEMVAVMGGSTTAQPYRWFEEMCVKAFLASRPHAEKLCHMVVLMLDSGLPCFKPETITHLRQRFVLEKSEREAAEFMRGLISKSQSSYSTKGYDQFQLLTNGIPY